MLPADGHVHSEWSWDAVAGAMEETCARAVTMGLPSLAFTEHADRTPWTLPSGGVLLTDGVGGMVDDDHRLLPPALDVDGYLACVERCRDRFPELVILSGVELGEPHWHAEGTAELLAGGRFDRVLGSLHSLRRAGHYVHAPDLFASEPPVDVVRAYLVEATRMVEVSGAFAVLAHVDYPVRRWPAGLGPWDPGDVEDELRALLRALAGSGRALEVNTRVPLHPVVVRWWREEGGEAVTFGSDAHDPWALAAGLAEAAALAEAHGFRAGRHPHDAWVRA